MNGVLDKRSTGGAVHVWRRDQVIDGVQRCQLCALHRAPQARGYVFYHLLGPELEADPGCAALPWIVDGDVAWYAWQEVSERAFLKRHSATLGGLVFVVIDEQGNATWSIAVGGGAFYFEDAQPVQTLSGLPTIGAAYSRGLALGRALLQQALGGSDGL